MKTKRTVVLSLAVCVCLAVACSQALAAQAETKQKSGPALSGTLNINTATAKDLCLLPGIGKKTAENIIAYRTEHGNFKSVDGLIKVKGVGKKTLEKCKSFCTIEGETTLARVKK